MEGAYFEKVIMEKVNHPNIHQMCGCFEDNSYYCIVTELFSDDMRNYISNIKKVLQEEDVRLVFKEML